MIKANILARAIELARSGQYHRKSDITKQLNKEGYERVNQHMDGMSVSRMIRNELVKAREESSS